MKISWLGHSAFSIKFGSIKILIDPFLKGNPVFDNNNFKSVVSEVTHIALTHGHSDHLGDTIEIAKKDTKFLELDVWLGKKDKVGVYSSTDIYKTIKKARLKKLQTQIIYDGPIEAPIKKGNIYGKLIINIEGKPNIEVDLVAQNDVGKINPIFKIFAVMKYLIFGSSLDE